MTNIQILKCPTCNQEYTHHAKTEIFSRSAEDSEHGMKITVYGATMNFDSNIEGNPSLRRDGMRLHFLCEACNDIFRVDIYQHKGNTYIEVHP